MENDLIPKDEISSQQLTSAAIEAIKPQKLVIGGPELPTPKPVGDYVLYFWKPEGAKHSTLAMVDVIGLGGTDEITTFVLRKEQREEGKIAKRLRSAAQTDPAISLINSLYFPKVYQIDEDSGWTAAEYVTGVEYVDLQSALKDQQFAKLYAEKVFELLIKTKQLGLYLTDTNFVNGHNIKFNSKTGQLKFVEPDALDFRGNDGVHQMHIDPLVWQIFQELPYGSNAEDVDNSNKRNFLFELMQQISTLYDWENLSQNHGMDFFSCRDYLMENDPDFRKKLASETWFDEVEEAINEFQNHYTLREHFSPEFISAVKTGDREAFDKVVRAHHKFKILKAYPKTNE